VSGAAGATPAAPSAQADESLAPGPDSNRLRACLIGLTASDSGLHSPAELIPPSAVKGFHLSSSVEHQLRQLSSPVCGFASSLPFS